MGNNQNQIIKQALEILSENNRFALKSITNDSAIKTNFYKLSDVDLRADLKDDIKDIGKGPEFIPTKTFEELEREKDPSPDPDPKPERKDSNKYKRPTFMTKRTPIIMPGYFPEYALPPLNKQSYASDFKKLVYMYAKLIDYEFANKSTNTTIMLTAAEIEERKNILNKYPIQFKNFNETYGETINKYRAILSRPSLKPVAPKPLQSGKQTPEGWGKVKTKLDDLLSKYNNLDKGSDEEKKINKIKYFEELQEYEKIKKIHSISGGSRRNMNRGRRFTRKVIH